MGRYDAKDGQSYSTGTAQRKLMDVTLGSLKQSGMVSSKS
jgi:hypothetical protein